MAPQRVTVSRPAGLAASQARVISTSTAPCTPPLSPAHVPWAQTARRAPSSSVAALAAVASADWCEAGAGAPTAALDLPDGGDRARKEASRAADARGGRLVTCGLWLARRRLVVVVLGPGGGARRVIRAALTDDARFGLVEYLAAAGAEVVATEALTRVDLAPVQAVRCGLAVWTAGDALVAALLGAAGIRDPVRAATLLARLPVIPLLRSSIRRLVVPDRRQLPLL